MQIIFPISPMGKPRMTQRDKWKKRPVIQRWYAYKDELKLTAKQERYQVEETLDIVFCIPMPKSWSKKKKAEMYAKPHQQKPDIDNLVKGFLDALCEDDSYVWSVTAEKYWAYEGKIAVIT